MFYSGSLFVKLLGVKLLGALLLSLLYRAGFRRQQESSSSCSSFSEVYRRELHGVCVGNTLGFHGLPSLPPLTPSEAALFSTSKSGKRFHLSVLTVKKDQERSSAPIQFAVEDALRGQEIVGFGGAFTDASAINWKLMNPTVQKHILEAYFGEMGLQYTLARVPMASCDFSTSIYSYNDNPGDFLMENFSIQVDMESGKLPLIKAAQSVSYRNITIFASPWAPPSWMTRENSTINCHIRGAPGGPYWQAWAHYFSKFLSAYRDKGIDIWAVTVQNEPVKQPLQLKRWQSQRFGTDTERDFIKRDLGPVLKRFHPGVKIISMDDQKDIIAEWGGALNDPEARQYVSGTGFHWYTDIDFRLGRKGDFDKLDKKHEMHPDKFLLATEACEGFLPPLVGTGSGVRIDNPNVIWRRAENYARDIIGDLQHHAVGWTDWNLVLDRDGGPNWAKNFADAPIIVDTEQGGEFYLQPMYYIMGHFSKYITPGSKRIGLAPSKDYSNIAAVAFATPEHFLVVVMQHRGGRFWPKRTLDFEFLIDNKSIKGQIETDSVATLVVPNFKRDRFSSA